MPLLFASVGILSHQKRDTLHFLLHFAPLSLRCQDFQFSSFPACLLGFSALSCRPVDHPTHRYKRNSRALRALSGAFLTLRRLFHLIEDRCQVVPHVAGQQPRARVPPARIPPFVDRLLTVARFSRCDGSFIAPPFANHLVMVRFSDVATALSSLGRRVTVTFFDRPGGRRPSGKHAGRRRAPGGQNIDRGDDRRRRARWAGLGGAGSLLRAWGGSGGNDRPGATSCKKQSRPRRSFPRDSH